MLAKHDMFNRLHGNPTAITMLASHHHNNLNRQTLVDMYTTIQNDDNSFVEQLDSNNWNGKQIPR